MMSLEKCGSLAQEPGTGGPGHLAFWLSTIDADGRPHMTAVGDFWVDGRYYLGRAVFYPGTPQTLDELLNAADAAMDVEKVRKRAAR